MIKRSIVDRFFHIWIQYQGYKQIVLSRIKKYTNLIYRTDLNGEIELTYDYGKFKINTII